MTVEDIYQQAQSLTPQERLELVALLAQSLLHVTPTEDGIHEALTIEPRSGQEIVALGLTGVWKDAPDGAEWQAQQRAKRRERHAW